MNKVILIGRLSKDPEARTTQNGISCSTFSVAIQREHRSQNGTYDADFFNVVAWRQTADYVNRYMGKGDRIAIIGSLQNRSYEARDGSKRYVTEVIADRVEGLGGRGSNDGNDGGRPERQTAPAQPESADEFMEMEDEELPF